jgi:hypothetical protein
LISRPFLDHTFRHFSEPPEDLSDCMDSPDPRNYFEYVSKKGNKYYYDMESKTTTFTFPSDGVIFDPNTRRPIYTPPGFRAVVGSQSSGPSAKTGEAAHQPADGPARTDVAPAHAPAEQAEAQGKPAGETANPANARRKQRGAKSKAAASRRCAVGPHPAPASDDASPLAPSQQANTPPPGQQIIQPLAQQIVHPPGQQIIQPH